MKIGRWRYSGQCLELPGCTSEGESKEEALANIMEAVEGHLEVEQLKRKKELVEITVWKASNGFFKGSGWNCLMS